MQLFSAMITKQLKLSADHNYALYALPKNTIECLYIGEGIVLTNLGKYSINRK